jgi:hypothetical protein
VPVLGASLGGVAVKGGDGVTEVEVTPECEICDGVEGALMAPDVDFKGVECVMFVGYRSGADGSSVRRDAHLVGLEVEFGC